MSGVAIARALMVANSTLLATVPAARVISGVVPVGTAMPAISVSEVSATQRLIVAMNASAYLVTERVQITAMAASYAQMKAVLALIRAALPLSRGTVGTFACDSVLFDSEGPDFYDADALLHMGSVDYIVRFTR